MSEKKKRMLSRRFELTWANFLDSYPDNKNTF